MEYLTSEQIALLVPEAYALDRSENIECIKSTALLLRHKKTDARVAVFVNEDENKLFSAAFTTPPEDDCGTPHIIEHSVLCGSEKYPVKDPFMQLVKSSMNTFLNAMTYADKTVYPVSSCNDKDFINLSNVYLDAVFSPMLKERREVFMQEGWHYSPADDGTLELGGVVYSEMQGAVSSPDSNVFDELIVSMFPDNAYGKNSGGDPDALPELTYEKLLDYYERHYHPSNCRMVLYGNMNAKERLEYIDREYLSRYDYLPPCDDIGAQEHFGRGNLRRTVKEYPVPSDESEDGRSFLAYGTLACDCTDAVECLAYDLLGDILIESPGAPVKNALISAGIGDEVYGGFLNHMKTPVFSVFAKNTDEDRAEEFLEIIKETLRKTAETGVNKKSLLSVIERCEFRFREGESGGASRGINVTLSMLQSWLYSDDDPFATLRADKLLAELRRLCETDYFEKLIMKLLDSDHESLLILNAKRGLGEAKSAALAEKLQSFADSLSKAEYEDLVQAYEKFTKYQDREETPEELSCIPLLSINDIKRDPSPLYIREGSLGEIPALYHDISSNGIVYVRFLFDISHVPSEELPYLDILSSALGKVDTEQTKYGDLLDEVRANTGGFGFTTEVYRTLGKSFDFKPYFEINLRTLPARFGNALTLASEIIHKTKLEDSARLREILAEMVSEKQRDIVYSGSEYSTARALAYISKPDAFEERLDGIEAYLFEKQLLSEFNDKASELTNKLRALLKAIFTRKNCLVSITSDSENTDSVTQSCADFLSELEEGEVVSQAPRTVLGIKNEAFLTGSQVQYVSQVGNLVDSGFNYRAEYQILSSVIKNDFLYPEIRMKGGAYGYSSAFSVNTGNVAFSTYRDPCLSESLHTFAKIPEFIGTLDLDADELTAHIIGTFGRLDRPSSAYMKAHRSLTAYMSGRTFEDIKRDREAMLDVSLDELRALAPSVKEILKSNVICVIGNEEKLLSERELFGELVRLS